MKTVGLFGKLSRPRVSQIMRAKAASLRRRYRVIVRDLDGRLPKKPPIDLAVIFGGDGTILQAARYLAPAGIGAIGVNLGKFGFLAGCVEEACEDLVADALAGRLKPVMRSMLLCRVERSGRKPADLIALNEVVITSAAPAQMVGVELSINDAAVSTLQGDGLIVSTATGSTGYSLSCGGPILCPDQDAIILAPLAAHTLAIRPMIAPSTDVIKVRVTARHADAAAIADGQVSIAMRHGDAARVRTAPFKFRLFEGPGWSFYRVLREKLRWGEEPNYAKSGD